MGQLTHRGHWVTPLERQRKLGILEDRWDQAGHHTTPRYGLGHPRGHRHGHNYNISEGPGSWVN